VKQSTDLLKGNI